MQREIKSAVKYAIMLAMIQLAKEFDQQIKQSSDPATNMIISNLSLACKKIGFNPESYSDLTEEQKTEISCQMQSFINP